MDARVPTPRGHQEGNALRQYGLHFSSLNVLNEHGLIIAEYDSWFDYNACIDIHPAEPRSGAELVIPFGFEGNYWSLMPTKQRSAAKEFQLPGIALTRAGQELSTVVDLDPVGGCRKQLAKFFETQGLRMTEVVSPEPRIV